jgi:hypothetical protein
MNLDFPEGNDPFAIVFAVLDLNKWIFTQKGWFLKQAH